MNTNKIKLPNRYGQNIYLEQVSPNKYKLTGDLSYMRIGHNPETCQIEFVDPSGGPFLAVNDKLPIGIIKSINKNYIFEIQ